MTIPTWLLQFGSIAGLVTLCFTVWDRLLSGRPSVFIRPAGPNGRDVYIQNLSRHDVLITKIRCSRAGVGVAHDPVCYHRELAQVAVSVASPTAGHLFYVSPRDQAVESGEVIEQTAKVTEPLPAPHPLRSSPACILARSIRRFLRRPK
jgi:hypothetical protein